MKKKMKILPFILCFIVIFGILTSFPSHAATPREIDRNVDESLARFTREVRGGQEFLKAAKGVLVIPKILQVGFFVGGQMAEGALRIDGKTFAYYNVVSASFGYQIGVQQKDIILVFMDQTALDKFKASSGWQAGVNGTVAVVNLGAEGSIDTRKLKEPIIGFVFDQTGLMAGVSVEGTKFTRLNK